MTTPRVTGFFNRWFPAWGAGAPWAGSRCLEPFMLAPFEVIGHRVQATAGHGALSFARVLVLADADPFCPLRQTVDYALSPDEAALPAGQWQGRVVLLGINNMATGYGGRLRLTGRIMGAQTQREHLAALPAPAHTGTPRRRSLESPDLLMLSGEHWQFFGTLTFKRERMPERVRPSMFNAAFRQLAKTQHLHFPRLAWCRREELGDLLGRRHYHFLLTGLPARAVNISTCFFLMHAWEKIGGGMARVRLYNQGQDGLEYITKCLHGGDAYETSKFAEGLSHLTLSDGLRRMLRARPVMGERRLAQRDTPTVGSFSS
jgi:hypothetical protein